MNFFSAGAYMPEKGFGAETMLNAKVLQNVLIRLLKHYGYAGWKY